MEQKSNRELKLERQILEPLLSETVEQNSLDDAVVLSFLTLEGRPQKGVQREIQTCSGDIYKIVNMLMDYAQILEAAVEQWELTGFHKASYKLHAKHCRRIAEKYAEGIGYNYTAAVEKCRKRRERGPRQDDGVGEDALVLASRQHLEVEKTKKKG